MKNLDKTRDDDIKQDSKKENLEGSDEQDDRDEDEMDSNDDNDDGADDESYGSKNQSRNTSGVKDNKLKPRAGGVNHGRDKKSVNADAAISN
jgi:hypothetical protein